MKHPGRIEFFYPGDDNPVFSKHEVAIGHLGGGALACDVDIALSKSLLDFNHFLLGRLTAAMQEAVLVQDNTAYDQICQDREEIRHNIDEINFVAQRTIKLRSN